jgi:hypothetical protein
VGLEPALELQWTSLVDEPVFELGRRTQGNGPFSRIPMGDDLDVTGNVFRYVDTSADPAQPWEYELKVRSRASVWSRKSRTLRIFRSR